MKSMRIIGSAVLVAGLLAAWACSDRAVYEEKGLAMGQPGMNKFAGLEPGETAVLERPYLNAPPLVPHEIGHWDITREYNDCLDCHLEGEDLGEGHKATKVPQSHFNNEFTGEQKSGEVIGNRYNCKQCHVPQASNPLPY